MTTNTDFTQSFDARDWAKAFVEHVEKNPSIATDEGTMISWFANALMRGYDEHAWRNPAPSVSEAVTDGMRLREFAYRDALERVAASLEEWAAECGDHGPMMDCVGGIRGLLASAPSSETVTDAERWAYVRSRGVIDVNEDGWAALGVPLEFHDDLRDTELNDLAELLDAGALGNPRSIERFVDYARGVTAPAGRGVERASSSEEKA